jgi:hypothetical protein
MYRPFVGQTLGIGPSMRSKCSMTICQPRRTFASRHTKHEPNRDATPTQQLSKRKQLMLLKPSESILRQVYGLRLGIVKETRFRRRDKEALYNAYEKPHGPTIKVGYINVDVHMTYIH